MPRAKPKKPNADTIAAIKEVRSGKLKSMSLEEFRRKIGITEQKTRKKTKIGINYLLTK